MLGIDGSACRGDDHGAFFAADRFPESVQPVIQILPLTPLISSLRAVMLEGATLGSQWTAIERNNDFIRFVARRPSPILVHSKLSCDMLPFGKNPLPPTRRFAAHSLPCRPGGEC